MLLNIITRDVWYVSVTQGYNSYSDFKLKKEILKSLSALPLVLLFQLTCCCFFVLGYCVIL